MGPALSSEIRVVVRTRHCILTARGPSRDGALAEEAGEGAGTRLTSVDDEDGDVGGNGRGVGKISPNHAESILRPSPLRRGVLPELHSTSASPFFLLPCPLRIRHTVLAHSLLLRQFASTPRPNLREPPGAHSDRRQRGREGLATQSD